MILYCICASVSKHTLVHTVFNNVVVCVCSAAEWNAADPLWTGRLKVIAKGDACIVQLIDTTSGIYL
jgi:hypothetical protein